MNSTDGYFMVAIRRQWNVKFILCFKVPFIVPSYIAPVYVVYRQISHFFLLLKYSSQAIVDIRLLTILCNWSQHATGSTVITSHSDFAGFKSIIFVIHLLTEMLNMFAVPFRNNFPSIEPIHRRHCVHLKVQCNHS